jgi:hypothetical protein
MERTPVPVEPTPVNTQASTAPGGDAYESFWALVEGALPPGNSPSASVPQTGTAYEEFLGR